MTDSSMDQGETGSSGIESADSNGNNIRPETSVTVEVETHPVPRAVQQSTSGNSGAPGEQARPTCDARESQHQVSLHATNITSEVRSEPGTSTVAGSESVDVVTSVAGGDNSATPSAGGGAGDRRQSSSEQGTSTEMSNNSRPNSSSRRQRNGLFGINLDLNFDPPSWLVPSNVAGRSISSLSMLPDWARPPVNIPIPNRETLRSVLSENRQSSQAMHYHHPSGTVGASGGGTSENVPTPSRLIGHTSVPLSTTPSGNWSSTSFASSGNTSSSTPNIQHHHHHHHHHSAPRTRHTVSSMRSVDEDLDADYNPVSTIDLGRDGRDPSHSYVIDMDSQMGGWSEDDAPTLRGTGTNASGGGGDDNGSPPDNGGGTRRNNSDVSLPQPDENTPSMADATATANERTRAAEILRDAPETRAFINEISRYTTIRPFIVINVLKGIFDHGTNILAFLALVVTFSHANSMVKKEVSKQRKRNLIYLSMIVINLAACVAFIYYIFNDMELYYALIFLPTGTSLISFWSLMWTVGVTDYVAKFATVLVKICIIALPGCVIPFQKRGKYYLFIEHTSQLYRSFLPMYPWIVYLSTAYEGTARMFGLFLAGLYIFFKISDSVGRFKDWLKALEKLLSNVHYGTSPTAKQLDSAGAICPICHDNFASPTRLSCGHIFCEECVATWFDRERTCPMCRAKVVDDPTYRDGSTSQYVQLF